MGCCNSKGRVPARDSGHPDIYYEGVKAVHEGRFTVSELFFQQAIQEHPGRAWWSDLLEAVTQGKKKKRDAYAEAQKKAAEEGEASPELPGLPIGEDEEEKKKAARGSDSTPTATDSDGVASADKKRDIELPTDKRLNDIIDFIRMLSDIARTYFVTGSVTSKPRYIGALYCGTICVHMQIFSHLLTMLREEQTAEIRERMNDPTIPSFKTYIWKKSYGKSTNKDKKDNHKKKKDDADELASDESILLSLELLETVFRYYWLSAIFNYVVVIFRVSQTLSPTEKDDIKKRNAIYNNIFENCTLAETCIMGVVQSFAHHYFGEAALTYFKQTEEERQALQLADITSGNGGGSSQQRSSHQDKQSTRYYASLLGSQTTGGADKRSLIGMSREFNATVPNTLSLPNVVPARFVLQKLVLRKHRARIQSPAERYSLYYVSWALSLNYDFIPGNSVFFDDHTAPDRHFAPYDLEQSKETPPNVAPAVAASPAAAARKLSGADEDVLSAASEAEEDLPSLDDRPSSSQAFPGFEYQPYINEELDLGSLHKACVLGFEEMVLLAKVVLCIKLRMYELQPEHGDAAEKRRANFAYFVSACFGTEYYERALCDQLTKDMRALFSDESHCIAQ